jgi:prephenate dehydrogenase
MSKSKVLNTVTALVILGLATMGSANARTLNHNQPHHGRQQTQDELNAQDQQDVIDRLYDQLLSSSEKILKQHPALVR